MYVFIAIQIVMLGLLCLGVWLYMRQSGEKYRISREQVHTLRNDLNAERLKTTALETELAETRIKP